MADVLVPRDVLERAANYVGESAETDGSTSYSYAVLTALDDALSEPALKGFVVPQDALWQADRMAAALNAIEAFVTSKRFKAPIPEELRAHLLRGVEAANTYSVYRLADTIEAVYHP